MVDPDQNLPQEETSRPSSDLEACPRGGEPIPEIRWGQTNCPRCETHCMPHGELHFECC